MKKIKKTVRSNSKQVLSQKNINDLPLEILLKIFQFLYAKDLCKAITVCKHWQNLITWEKKQRTFCQCFRNEEGTNYELDKFLKTIQVKPALGLFFCWSSETNFLSLRDYESSFLFDQHVPSSCCSVFLKQHSTKHSVLECAIFSSDIKLDTFVINYKKMAEFSLEFDIMYSYAFNVSKILANTRRDDACIIMFTQNKCMARLFVTEIFFHFKQRNINRKLTVWGGVVDYIKIKSGLSKSRFVPWICHKLSSPDLESRTLILYSCENTVANMEKKFRDWRSKFSLKKHTIGLMFSSKNEYWKKEITQKTFAKVFPGISTINLLGVGNSTIYGSSDFVNNDFEHYDSSVFVIMTYGS